MSAATIFGGRRSSILPILGACALAGTLAGCVQSSTIDTRKEQPVPATAAVATGAPVVLSGASYADGNVPTPPSSKTPPAADVVTTPPETPPRPVETPTQPLFAAPVVPPPPAAVAATTGDLPSVPATTTDGYPNINVPPRQPEGQLLTPEERAKLIAELNALAGRKPGTE